MEKIKLVHLTTQQYNHAVWLCERLVDFTSHQLKRLLGLTDNQTSVLIDMLKIAGRIKPAKGHNQFEMYVYNIK